MKLFTRTFLAASVLATTAMAVQADEFNHGNHNDQQYTYSIGTIETVDCGSASLATCINAVNIEAYAKGRCEAIKNIGGLPPYGAAYWHSAQAYAVRPVSAIDGNNGTGSYDYSIEVIFSCSALLHPGTVVKF